MQPEEDGSTLGFGDDISVGLLERVRVIELWVRHGADLFARIAPVMGVVRDAAGSDPEMAEQWRTNEAERLTAFGALVEVLADREALARGLSAEDATDIVFALNSVEVFLLLTGSRGWSVRRWEEWLVSALEGSLLGR